MIGVDRYFLQRLGGGAVRGGVRLLGGRWVPGVARLPHAPQIVDFPSALLPIDEQLAAGRVFMPND